MAVDEVSPRAYAPIISSGTSEAESCKKCLLLNVPDLSMQPIPEFHAVLTLCM